MQSVNRGLLGLMSVGHLSVDVTTGALPALLPFLQPKFHLSYLSLAAVIMTSNLTSSIVQPIFGIASDRASARYLLPLGVLLAVAGFAALGIAGSYWLLLAAVAFSGIGSAGAGVVSATHGLARRHRGVALRRLQRHSDLCAPLRGQRAASCPASNGPLLFAILAVGAAATVIGGPIADRVGKKAMMAGALALVPVLLAIYLFALGAIAVAALIGVGACISATMTITVLLGHEYLPARVALASSLLIGFTSGIGGLAVGALGYLADVSGLAPTLWALVAAGLIAFALTLVLPEVQTLRRPMPAELTGAGSLESAG